MAFTEDTFLFLFMPLSVVAYLVVAWLSRRRPDLLCRLGDVLLVALSLAFYAWAGAETLALFVAFVCVVYFLGGIAKGVRQGNLASSFVKMAVALPVALLAYYKYLPFLCENLNAVTGWGVETPPLVVPIGLSFVVFEAVSYIVDIYRGDAEPGSLLDTFLFLSLFPKLVSGPIVLWRDFQQQLALRAGAAEDPAGTHAPSLANAAEGFDLIAMGLAKKVIIADTFGARIAAIGVTLATSGVDTPTLWLRALLYFFQLYYDFSGYSDIAIGLCRVFGFELRANFDHPYASASVSEFWRRWHISLGAWWLLTTVVVFFAWVLFMSADLPSALDTYAAMLAPSAEGLTFTWRYFLSQKVAALLVVAAVLSVAGATPVGDVARRLTAGGVGLVYKRVALLALLVATLTFVASSSYSPFLYFQF